MLWRSWTIPGTVREIIVLIVKKVRSFNRLQTNWMRRTLEALMKE